MKKVIAFDMGKGSIGYCVRFDNEIMDLGSLIIDINHADIKDNRTRRRTFRTLCSKHAREKWFNKLWKKNGLNVLENGDKRFTKEFAGKNDNTIYNSTILRCALIQGKKLEEWQIYKAIHSAIQRRGYDSSVAWANSTDDKENEKAVKKYSCDNDVELIISDEYKYPCFYDALLLGLWSEQSPYEFKRSIDLSPNKIRTAGRVAPRSLVTKELTALWKNAKEQLPQLKNISAEEFLYGEYLEPYGSYYNPEWIKYRGKESDWQGVLGQKIPRFDNRIVSKCRLLPKRNVCSADTIENIVFMLLMQLKNLRFTDAFTYEQRRLAPYEIKQIYEKKRPEWINQLDKKRSGDVKNPSFSVTKKDIENVIGKKAIKEEISPLKADITGRSSFCRRSCKIMTEIITEGIEPKEINIEKYIDKEGTKDGITKDEIQAMLSKIGEWNNLYIPDNRCELEEISKNADIQSDIIIGNITNPIVRNRLQIFKNLLSELISEYGKPDEVIFEFVRDGADNSLFGKIKADNYTKYMKQEEKQNEDIRQTLAEAGADVKENFLKYKLALAQDFKCVYSGKKIGIGDFLVCEIDHIYPRSLGGNDALYNKVICFSEENQHKGNRTPYEWLFNDKQRWAEYTTRILNMKKLGKKKRELLLSPAEKCVELIESRNALAETAQVAKTASMITHFMCGWGMQTEGSERHVFVENGYTTSKIRNIYKLNSILGSDKNKNRSNPKHHALDAICISYARELKFDEQKHRDTIEGFYKPYIEQKISELMPFPYAHKKQLKSNIRPLETIYGKRIINGIAYITNKIALQGIKKDRKAIKNIIDNVIRNDLMEKLSSNISDEEWQELLKNYIHPKKKTRVKRILTIVSEGMLETDLNGRERIGEFCDFGTKGTKGQFKHSKAHKGQILYYNNNTVKVMPIYANKSAKEIKEKLENMNCKLYHGGEVFYSGCLIQIPKDFRAGRNQICPKGIYKLRTIQQDGTIKIENNIGEEILTSAKNLTEAGFYKLKEHETV